MKTIAVIDKHPIVRAGLEVFIKNNFNDVGLVEFESFYHFHKVCIETIPDLFIIGNTVELPNNQCKLILGLIAKNKKTKVIIYDDSPDFLKVSLYFKSGATGYLSKQSKMDELLKCISEVENGKNYVSSEIMEILIPKWISTGKDTGSDKKITLTHREFEIATFLIDGSSVSEISKKLQRKTSTISTIKKNLFRKLKINNLVDLKDSLERSMNRQIA